MSSWELAVFAVYGALLLSAVWFDVTRYMIPNVISLALVALFLCVPLVSPFHIPLLEHLGAGLLVFVAGAVLFRFRLLGGGDVKLLAATSVWFGFDMLGTYLLVVAVIGGALALVLMGARTALFWLVVARRGSSETTLPRIFQSGERKMPYGAAIGSAGILVAPQLTYLLLPF